MLLFVAFLSGCASTPLNVPNLTNVPQPEVEKGSVEVWIRPFKDERANADKEPEYYGTIRNGWGIPYQRLRFDKSVVEKMNDVLVNVLRNAGYRTNLGVPSQEVRVPIIVGNIKTFYGDRSVWTFDRTIEINVEICMLDSQSNSKVWCNTISGSDTDTRQTNHFLNFSEMMGPWITRLTEDKAKELIKTKSIAQSWKEYISTQALVNKDFGAGSAEGRLSDLKRLLDKGLISETEYSEKRSAIIKGL